MDGIDKQLVLLLQKNGKLTMKELSAELGLSITPIYERLRRLERKGLITGYHASVDPKKAGFGFVQLVQLHLVQIPVMHEQPVAPGKTA